LRRYQNPLKVYLKDKKVFALVVLGSIIGPYLGITLSFIAVIYTHVGVAATLMSTSPIMILPLSMIFYKEKLSWKSIVGAIIAVGGISLLFLT
ncbi:MAG: DMT family transporter, partial [Ignavibacteria bacterium]|nr:DMT family transporter [Ignavibacteria bacterium]